ncbi:MAG: hypothetical protein HYS04_22680 [Acidobacteria bacterium]|nr:hypothetical protein [Acidobacteriota bacterium]
MKTVLIVAAEPFELSAIAKRCEKLAATHWGLRASALGELNGARTVLVAHGPGAELARQAARTAAARERVDAVLSTGVCGALDPSLAVGEVFVASRVRAGSDEYASCAPRTSRAFQTGALVSDDRVIVTAREKQELGRGGARAVEMESGALAALARQWTVPFYCVRAVSDRSDEDLVLDFNALRDSSGRFSTGRILLQALRRPFRVIPGLLRLAVNRRLGVNALGDFIADCRF